MAPLIDMRGAMDGASDPVVPAGVITVKVRGDFAKGVRMTSIGYVALQIKYQSGAWEDVSDAQFRETGQARFRVPEGNPIRIMVKRCQGVDVEVWDES